MSCARRRRRRREGSGRSRPRAAGRPCVDQAGRDRGAIGCRSLAAVRQGCVGQQWQAADTTWATHVLTLDLPPNSLAIMRLQPPPRSGLRSRARPSGWPSARRRSPPPRRTQRRPPPPSRCAGRGQVSGAEAAATQHRSTPARCFAIARPLPSAFALNPFPAPHLIPTTTHRRRRLLPLWPRPWPRARRRRPRLSPRRRPRRRPRRAARRRRRRRACSWISCTWER